jgi:hypothetical protein
MPQRKKRPPTARARQQTFAFMAGPVPVAPRPATAPPAPPRRPPGKVPYDVALREIVRVVRKNLEDCSEQWSDEARQDLVSTLFTAAAKEKRIAFNFDREAA